MTRIKMKSISAKLTLAFLAVSLIVIGLAAFFIWRTTVQEFETVVVERIRSDFITKVTDYYEENGSWQGIIPRLFTPPGAQDGTNQQKIPDYLFEQIAAEHSGRVREEYNASFR